MLKSAALHWFTFYAHVQRHQPYEATMPSDLRALRDVVQVQTFGDEGRALALIEEIVMAPIPGVAFADRYEAFWWWTECGRPARYVTPTVQVVRDIAGCIAANVAGRAA